MIPSITSEAEYIKLDKIFSERRLSFSQSWGCSSHIPTIIYCWLESLRATRHGKRYLVYWINLCRRKLFQACTFLASFCAYFSISIIERTEKRGQFLSLHNWIVLPLQLWCSSRGHVTQSPTKRTSNTKYSKGPLSSWKPGESVEMSDTMLNQPMTLFYSKQLLIFHQWLPGVVEPPILWGVFTLPVNWLVGEALP